MLRCACLFAHDHPSTPESDWDTEHGHVDGWAEWFESIPLLFLYLMGDAEHLPQIAPCAMFGDADSPACLMAPLAEARARWQALDARMRALLPLCPDAVQKQWAHMHRTITESTRHWLILDCSAFCDAALGTPEMFAFLQQVQARCTAWGPAGRFAAGDLPAALLPLLDEATGEWGWWNPSVVERAYQVEAQPHDEWPDGLRAAYEPVDEYAWLDEVQAYRVRPTARDDDPDGAVGLVTPYGRWLVNIEEGASQIYVDTGYIVVLQRGEWNDGRPSGLKDLNGKDVVPVSAGYCNLSPVTRTLVLGCEKPATSNATETTTLRRLPDCTPLFDNLTGAALNDDGRVRLFHPDDTESVVDATTGALLFDARYKHVFAFKKKLGLAVVERNVTGEPGPHHSGVVQGVIHESGRLVVPCEYAWIHHAYKQPPKILQGRRLLAFTAEGRPHFYSIDGILLAALDCTVAPWIWTPAVKDNQLMAFDGEGMDARVVWVSLSDYSFFETGETRADCVQMLRDGFKNWLPQ